MKTLKAMGHTCEEAEDGQIALNKVKDRGDLTAFEAILMDFVMPIMVWLVLVCVSINHNNLLVILQSLSLLSFFHISPLINHNNLLIPFHSLTHSLSYLYLISLLITH